jgi:murein DD-endopeptidase MepM/ murein hydrolase activator NlpD
LHGKGNYQSPIRGFDPERGNRVTSNFGIRTRPGTNRNEPHLGVDIGAPEGTPIYAAHSGVIQYKHQVEYDDQGNIIGGYGNYAVITGAHGIQTLYGHMTDESMSLLPSGTQVQKGQLIGYVGKSGFATGPHLHFGVRHQYNGHNPFPNIPSYPENPRSGELIYYDPRKFLEYMMNR